MANRAKPGQTVITHGWRAKVVQRLSSDDVMAVAHYLARLAPPLDASPALASQAGARAKLLASRDTWRCGSAPLAKGQP